MESYKIHHPYLDVELKDGFLELEILSEGLIYAEIGPDRCGVQCNNMENVDKIRDKCTQVADLIREIDKLNKIDAKKEKI